MKPDYAALMRVFVREPDQTAKKKLPVLHEHRPTTDFALPDKKSK